MKFQLAALFATAASCTASQALDLNNDIAADSLLGRKLLAKARGLEDAVDYTWLNKYSIRFNSCHTIHLFGSQGEEQQEEGESNPVGNQQLVNFKLCPDSSECDKCKNGGEYVVQMREFLEVYSQAKAELEEAQCEAVEENCNCDYYYGDDEACAAKCYADAGLDFCGEEEDFELEQYIECIEAEFSDDAYYASTYFVGPTCTNEGTSINLQVFKDNKCTVATDNSVYAKYMFDENGAGMSLPYASKSIVDSDCISCKVVDENAYYNDNNNYYEAEDPIELCMMLYSQSAKCENEMSGKSYADIGSCTYINKILPALESAYENSGMKGNGGVTFLAWLFFITTLAASGGVYYFYTAAKRNNVGLSGSEGVSGGIL